MQPGQLERYLYKWVSASILTNVTLYILLSKYSRQSKHISFHRLSLFLHPQGLKCSRTLPWCCTSWWRSLTGPIPQRLYWRTQVPLGGSAEPASQVATHREVLTHTQVHSARDSATLTRAPVLPFKYNKNNLLKPRALQVWLVSPKVCKLFQLMICSLAVWPVNGDKRKWNRGQALVWNSWRSWMERAM